MTRRNAFIFFFFIACAAFAAGAVTAMMREWGSPLVFVTISNDTALPVSSVTLTYSTCGSTNSLSTQDLPVGKTHTFKFPVCGEGGYGVTAVLQGGSTLLSPGGYVENGYSATERIEQTTIRSDIRMYHL